MANQNRLSNGLVPLSYLGVNPTSPAQLFVYNHPPTPVNYQNVSIGDMWLVNGTEQVWILVSKANTDPAGMALWVELSGTVGPAFNYVTNAGTANPAGGILNVIGDNIGVKTTGAGNTITISLTGSLEAVQEVPTNVGGTAFPDPNTGTLSIFGANNIYTNTGGTGPDQVIVNLVNSPSVSGTFTSGLGITATTGEIATLAGDIQSSGQLIAGTNLIVGGTITTALGVGPVLSGYAAAGQLSTVVNTGGGISAGYVLTYTSSTTAPTWQAAGGGGGGAVNTLTGDSGGAVSPTGGGTINVIGGGTIFAVAGSANTLTVGPGTGAATTGAVLIGGSNPAWNRIVSGGAGLTVTSGNGTITITNTNPGGGTTVGMTTADVDHGGSAGVVGNTLTFTGVGGVSTGSPNTGLIWTSAVGATLYIGQQTNPTISGNLTLSGLGTGVVTTAAGVLSSTIGTANQVMMTNKAATAPVWGTLIAGTNVTFVTTTNTITINASGGGGSGTVTQVNGGNNIVISGSPTTTPTVNLSNTIHWGASDATHCSIFTNVGSSSPGTYTWLHSFGTNNSFFGTSAGNQTTLTGTNLVGIGTSALLAATSTTDSTAVGYFALTASQTGNRNVAVGSGALSGLVNGQHCVALGYNAGSSYTNNNEANNLCLGHNVTGTNAESNVIRIGNTAHTTNIQQGIYGVTPSGTNEIVTINSTGQLGVSSTLGGNVTFSGNVTVDGSLTLPAFTNTGALVTNAAGAITDANASNNGYVLTSNGAGSPPSFKSPPYPNTPAFMYYQTGNINNVTGSTPYNLGSGGGANGIFTDATIGYDQGFGAPNFYGGDGISQKATFTSPIDGIYQIIMLVSWLGNITSGSNLYSFVITPYGTFGTRVEPFAPAFTALGYSTVSPVNVLLREGDVAYFQFDVQLTSPSNVIGIAGVVAGTPNNYATYVCGSKIA